MTIMDVYEWFFREGGFRLMRLLVIKEKYEPDPYRDEFDVVALMELQHCGEMPKLHAGNRAGRRNSWISDICDLDQALKEVMAHLPWKWGGTVETYFGCGVRKVNGVSIRKRSAENALKGVCKAINEHQGPYDFASEGLPVVYKLMSYLEQASAPGADNETSLLMRAVTCMKLFRSSENGILYTDALEEFCEKSALMQRQETDGIGRGELEEEIMIRDVISDGQQRSRLQSKVSEDRSCVLIERMYEIYSIMCAVRDYMPEKYERMMSFHWTKSRARLLDLFLEVAAMLAAAEDGSGA